MRIEITFHADPDDEDAQYRNLDGKRLTMESIDSLNVSTVVDVFPGPEPGSKLPGETGCAAVSAHGSRAMWSDVTPAV